MSKDSFNSVLFRNLSPEENEILEQVRKITGKGRNTEAIMTACKQYPKLIDKTKQLEETVSDLKSQLGEISNAAGNFCISFDSLRKFVS